MEQLLLNIIPSKRKEIGKLFNFKDTGLETKV